MKISKIRLWLLIMITMKISVVFADQLPSATVRYEQWEMSRHGEKIVNMVELSALVKLWSQDTAKILELRYPGGEEGELWVQELMDWLIALGVPSSSMHTVPGSGNEDIMSIVLVQGKKTNE